jgi:hypothetical protein
MERQSKESRGLEAHCRGGQGPPRAVAPSERRNMEFFAWPQPRSRVRRHLHVVVSRAHGVPVVVRRKT